MGVAHRVRVVYYGGMNPTRYPYQPLARLAVAQWKDLTDGSRAISDYRKVADVCQVLPMTARRWEQRGLSVWAADKAAIRAGFHPAIVWPDWGRG